MCLAQITLAIPVLYIKGLHAGKWPDLITGDPLHSRALAHSRAPLFTQPCPHCSHSRAPGEQWAWLCVFTLQGSVQGARLCRGSPVLMTSKPDAHSTLGYHWTDYIGTTLADDIAQLSPSGNPVLICIIGTHWKTTGIPLETHWLPTILYPVAFQCTMGSKFQAHWIATGLPLNYYWLRVRDSLTYWGRVTHICVSEIIIIGSDNGLSPSWRQAIIWTNAEILLIGPLGINFSEILIEINTISFNKMHLKMSSAKWRLFRLGLNVLTRSEIVFSYP